MIKPEEEQQQRPQQEGEEGQAAAAAAAADTDASRSASAAHKPVPPPSPAASASAASPTNSSPTAGDSSSTPSSAAAPVTTAAPPSRYNAPLSRRTHAKSRLGCFTCKRRRVKCNEGRPVCSSCRRLGLRCEYPPQQPATAAEGVGTLIASSANPSAYASSSSSSSAGGPQAAIPMLTLQDLRFYHQFLTVGFPALPLKADFIWPLCAAMSHEVRQKKTLGVFIGELSLTVPVRLPRPRPPRPRRIAPLAARARLPRVPAAGAAAPHHRHPRRQRQARPAAAHGPGGRCPLRGRHVPRRADEPAARPGGHVRVPEHVARGEPDQRAGAGLRHGAVQPVHAAEAHGGLVGHGDGAAEGHGADCRVSGVRCGAAAAVLGAARSSISGVASEGHQRPRDIVGAR